MNRKRNLWIFSGILAILVLAVVAGSLFLLGASPANAANSIFNALNLQEDDEGDRPIAGEALEKASAAALEFTGDGQVTGTEVGDEEGYYEVEVTTGSGQVDVHLDENFNVIGQETDRDDVEDEVEDGGEVDEDASEGEDTPITGSALDRASSAALEYLGGGRVTGTEVGDEEGFYEIEVTLEDGSQVDVHLDENFNVIGQEAEGAEVEDD